MDTILERFNLKYDDLNTAEKETLNTMLQSLRKNELTIPNIRAYLASMRDAVEDELCKESEYVHILFFRVRNDKNVLLKARLRNYRLLEAFLTSPEKAEKALESALAAFPKQEKKRR